MGGPMIASATILPRRRIDRRAVLRMLAAGTAWGIVMTAGFAGFALWNCGSLCAEDVAVTAVTTTAAGILTIGPLAAFGANR
jgi:hypothetical protein